MQKINKNIIALGVNNFFTDFSTEMILPLLPIFLERFLHATKEELGSSATYAGRGAFVR